MKWLDGITDSIHKSLNKLWEWWGTGRPGVLQSMGSQTVRQDWVTKLKWWHLSPTMGLPGGASGKEPVYQFKRYKRYKFDPWVGKIPWRRAQQSTPYSCWRIPWTDDSGRLQSIESQRVKHDWSDLDPHHTIYSLLHLLLVSFLYLLPPPEMQAS